MSRRAHHPTRRHVAHAPRRDRPAARTADAPGTTGVPSVATGAVEPSTPQADVDADASLLDLGDDETSIPEPDVAFPPSRRGRESDVTEEGREPLEPRPSAATAPPSAAPAPPPAPATPLPSAGPEVAAPRTELTHVRPWAPPHPPLDAGRPARAQAPHEATPAPSAREARDLPERVESRSSCTSPQLRRFIKSRVYVPMHELRRRFAIEGTEDEVWPVDVAGRRVFVGLPPREASLLGDLLRGGDVGYELSLDPIVPIVVGVFPMRPVVRG